MKTKRVILPHDEMVKFISEYINDNKDYRFSVKEKGSEKEFDFGALGVNSVLQTCPWSFWMEPIDSRGLEDGRSLFLEDIEIIRGKMPFPRSLGYFYISSDVILCPRLVSGGNWELYDMDGPVQWVDASKEEPLEKKDNVVDLSEYRAQRNAGKMNR